ncbi:hypothetical protein T484DRAFT_1764338 [Baffinella frigidus]|nr:hypothetical protein T484DRAFT_1764338 [Cryptophyta sp. CCMP2293]
MSSLVFIPVISEGFLAPLAGIDVQPSAPNVGKPRLVGSDADQQDNVLYEQLLALALVNRPASDNVLYEQLLALALVDKKTDRLPGDKCVMQEIFPILAGQRLEDGTLSNFFADGNNATESGGGKYPTTGSPATTEGVSKFLAENSVQGVSKFLAENSVQAIN